MKRETLSEMNYKVVKFLSEYGNYPAIKEVDERILRAEERLNNKLLKLQAGVEAEFIRALRERGYLPSNLREQRRFVSRIFEIPFNEMKTVIADESIEGAELGRQMTFEDLLNEGFRIQFRNFSEEVRNRLWEKV